MARPREFDRDGALEGAKSVFWRRSPVSKNDAAVGLEANKFVARCGILAVKSGVELVVDEGKFLRNPNDPRDKNTPDPPQPKDEFVLKFVKP